MSIKNFILIAGLSLQPVISYTQKTITVQQAVEIALNYNLDIQLEKNYSESTRTDFKYSIGLFTPDIAASATQLWNRNDQKQTLADNTERNKKGIQSDNITASIQATWVVFDGTKMFLTKKRIEETAILGELSLRNQTNNTIALVINSYFKIVREKQQFKALKEQITISETRVKLAEKKLEVGTGSKPELLQAKVDLNAQRSAIIEQEALIVQLKEQFNGLLARKLPEDYEVSDSISINLNIIKEDVSSEINQSNPSLAVAESNVEIALLALRERRAERFPILSFNSAYNFSRNNNKAVVNPFSALFTQNRGFNYGFSASLPLFRGLEIKRSIRQAEYGLQYEKINLEQQKNQVNIEVNNAFVNYEKARNILLIEEENIGLAKENVFIAMERFQKGMNTFIEVRTTQISLEEAYNRLIIARYNAKVAETELLRLKGALLLQ